MTTELHSLRQQLADIEFSKPTADTRGKTVALKARIERLEMQVGLHSTIKHAGQQRSDEPQYAVSKSNEVAYSVAQACGRDMPSVVAVFDGYKRYKNNWVQ